MAAQPKTRKIRIVFRREVKKEYRIAEKVIKKLKAEFASRFRIEDKLSWLDVPPGIDDDPQRLIEKELQFEKCDIFIGILWKSLGDPKYDGKTLIEREIGLAEKAFKETGKPRVMLYFSVRGLTVQPGGPDLEEDIERLGRIEAYRKRLEAKWLLCYYEDLEEFETQLRTHLSNHLKNRPEPSFSVSSNSPGMRAAGIAEVIGDIELGFTGSVPARMDGSFVPFRIQVALNVNITNRIKGDHLEDVTLMLDDGIAVPGVLNSATSVRFDNVPIWRRRDAEPRVRILNLRANASQLGVPVSSEVPFSRLQAFVSVTGAHPVEGFNQVLTVGVPSEPCEFHVQKVTPATATSGRVLVNHVDLVFSELFLNAFKNAFEERAGPLGTRFLIRFFGVAEGLRLFVSSRDLPSERNAPNALLVEEADEVGHGGNIVRAVAGDENNVPFAEVDVDGGYGSVTWEWVGDFSTSLGLLEKPRFRLKVEDSRTETTPVSFDVTGSLAPLSTESNAAEGEPVPRFIDVGGVKRIALKTPST